MGRTSKRLAVLLLALLSLTGAVGATIPAQIHPAEVVVTYSGAASGTHILSRAPLILSTPGVYTLVFNRAGFTVHLSGMSAGGNGAGGGGDSTMTYGGGGGGGGAQDIDGVTAPIAATTFAVKVGNPSADRDTEFRIPASTIYFKLTGGGNGAVRVPGAGGQVVVGSGTGTTGDTGGIGGSDPLDLAPTTGDDGDCGGGGGGGSERSAGVASNGAQGGDGRNEVGKNGGTPGNAGVDASGAQGGEPGSGNSGGGGGAGGGITHNGFTRCGGGGGGAGGLTSGGDGGAGSPGLLVIRLGA